MKKKLSLYPYLLTLPALVFITIVSLYPTLYSFYLSMTRSKKGIIEFVGLRNYSIILRSADFRQSLWLTIIFTVFYVLLTVIIAYILALMLNRGLKLTGVYMTIIFLPWVLSEITSGVVWRWMFYQDYGIIQNLLAPIFKGKALITTNWGAMAIVIAATTWRSISFGMLLLLAGLQTVPREIYEAASIDGSNGWNSFWKVTWPLVRPTTIVTTVFLTIQAINGVGMVLAITEGGPGRATEILGLHMYREAMQFYNFGYAAALSVVLLLINIVLAAFYLRALERENALAG
ncbi:MAG: sugar ABC transporter permease [Anaerolineae bacterium]|nr:sugar ABC transporter permease [Anaerolineae bacterium]